MLVCLWSRAACTTERCCPPGWGRKKPRGSGGFGFTVLKRGHSMMNATSSAVWCVVPTFLPRLPSKQEEVVKPTFCLIWLAACAKCDIDKRCDLLHRKIKNILKLRTSKQRYKYTTCSSSMWHFGFIIIWTMNVDLMEICPITVDLSIQMFCLHAYR